MLHQFRCRLDLPLMRELNRQLLRPLVEGLDPARSSLAIMDSTDLPAPVNCFKKTVPHSLRGMRR